MLCADAPVGNLVGLFKCTMRYCNMIASPTPKTALPTDVRYDSLFTFLINAAAKTRGKNIAIHTL